MQIELERLIHPEAAEEVECAMCERPFTLGVAVARVLVWDGADGGVVCPECAVWLADGPMGVSRPEAFPNLEEFVRRLCEWETPEYPSMAACDAELWRRWREKRLGEEEEFE